MLDAIVNDTTIYETLPGTDLPRLDLWPVGSEHADAIHAWISEPTASCWLDLGGGRQEMSKREIYLMVTSTRNHARLFALPGDDVPLGLVCLNDVTNLMGSAEAWVVRGVFDRGPLNVTASACLQIMANGFIDQGRETISSWVVARNHLSLALHARLGCTEVGRLRRRHRIQGRLHDRILFDITRSEFAARFPKVPSERGECLGADGASVE